MSKKESSAERTRRIRAQQSQKGISISRRRFIELALLGTGGYISLRLFGNILKDDPERLSDEEIILRKAKELGINPSRKEQQLWSDTYRNTSAYIEPSDSQLELVAGRLNTTMGKMLDSENPYFREAAEGFYDAISSGEVSPQFASSTGQEIGEGLGYFVGMNNETTDKMLLISQEYVLNDSSGLTLAHTLAHEWKHYQNNEEVFDSMPSGITHPERVNLYQNYANRPDRRLNDESLAYGVEANAYIYQAGLLGRLYDVETSGAEDRAANFIITGMSATDPEWQSYIASMLKI